MTLQISGYNIEIDDGCAVVVDNDNKKITVKPKESAYPFYEPYKITWTSPPTWVGPANPYKYSIGPNSVII